MKILCVRRCLYCQFIEESSKPKCPECGEIFKPVVDKTFSDKKNDDDYMRNHWRQLGGEC